MKIAHISHTDGGSGAGRAAYRIHRSLLELGENSSLFVSTKRTQDDTVFTVNHNALSHFIARANEYLEAKVARFNVSSAAGHFSPAQFGYFDPTSDTRITAADVITLYWINGAFITPEKLAGLKQPIVWRLSDVWPFTGGCHYPGSCERFTAQCRLCPQLAQPGEQDISRRLFERKQKLWKNIDLTIAAPSEWIAGLARKSALFSERRIEVIPTGVDTDIYRPFDRAAARARFGIQQDKTVILFGAMDTSDPRKGFAQLHDALAQLAQGALAPRLLAVVFGDTPTNATLPIPSMFLGRLSDDEALAAAYSCADMVVVPSLEDNLPNVALEAIACGAPVVGFNVCGMPEIVQHGVNGMLADAPYSTLLAAAMERLLATPEPQQFAVNARAHAVTRFSQKQHAQAYLALYRELLGAHAV